MTRRIEKSRMKRIAVLPVALLAFQAMAAHPVVAQLGEYTPPGTTVDRPGDDKQRLEDRMENALWDVGPVRLNPWVGVTNASLVSNAFAAPVDEEQTTDFTMTLGAGVEGIVPFGQKVFLTFDVVPQYVLWLEEDDRNAFNHSYGTRLFGYYNRLYLEAGAERRDRVGVVSSEVDQPINTRRDALEGVAELRIGGSFHLFTSAILAERTSREEEDDPRLERFSLQDREETVLRAGLRYRPRENVLVGLGLESAEADFLSEEKDLSNAGDYPFVELRYDAPRFFVTTEIVFLELEPEGEGSEFLVLDDTQWDLQVTLNPGWRMTYILYGRRDFSYALGDGYAHFAADRYGGRVRALLSERWRTSLFLETGVDDYQEQQGVAERREDDVTAWGINFSVDITPRFGLTLGYRLTEYDSNIPGRDRDAGQLTLGFGVQALALGQR